MESVDVKFASLDKYILGKTLGKGAHSKVKLAWDPSSDQYYAMKVIKHTHPNLNLKILKKEIEILSNLKHPNIIKIGGCFGSADYVKKNGNSYKAVAIIMELVSGGELFEYIAEFGRFSEEAARTYFQMLLDTVEYCHQNGIAHRDLKPENLIFDNNFNLKIADFGFATFLEGNDGSGQLHTFMGTEAYMAPEIHLGKPYSGVSVDLFACGIILFILVSGGTPFPRADPKNPWYKLIHSGKHDVFWSIHEKNMKQSQGNFYSEEFRDLMNAMFAFNPDDRPSIQDIKGHKWYNGATVDIESIKEEFNKRKQVIEEKLQKQRDAKKEQKLMAKLQIPTTEAFGAYGGFKPYRSLELGLDSPMKKELESKVDFSVKRHLGKYQSESGHKVFSEIFTVLDPDFIFKLLCTICEKSLVDFSVDSERYKIKGKVIKDEGRCGLNILLTKVDDFTTCIEFHKTSGNMMILYKLIDEIKKKLPIVETEEEVKAEIKENNSE